MKMLLNYDPRTKKVIVDFIGIPKELLPKGVIYLGSCWINRSISVNKAKKIIAILLEADRKEEKK